MTIKDRKTQRLIASMRKEEEDIRGERRRRLANGFNRALLHLNDEEIGEIEPLIQRAVGRSIMSR